MALVAEVMTFSEVINLSRMGEVWQLASLHGADHVYTPFVIPGGSLERAYMMAEARLFALTEREFVLLNHNKEPRTALTDWVFEQTKH